MRIVIRWTISMLVASLVVAAGAAFFMKVLTLTLFRENAPSFLGNLLLNLVAEFAGLAVGIFLAAKIASRLASDKLDVLAPRFVKLVSQLRSGGTISPQAARSCVVCAVGVISDDRLRQARSKRTPSGEEKHCRVCALSVKTVYGRTGDLSCFHCGLPGNVWGGEEIEDTSKEEVASPAEDDLTEGY